MKGCLALLAFHPREMKDPSVGTVCTAAEKGGWRENTGDSKQTRTSALDLGEMALPV